MNPNGNVENLKPFKKGSKRASEAGKKGGKSPSLKGAMKRLLTNGTVDPDLIAKGILLHAAKNPGMARLALEYMDGKVTQPVEHTGGLTAILSTVEDIDDKEQKRLEKELGIIKSVTKKSIKKKVVKKKSVKKKSTKRGSNEV